MVGGSCGYFLCESVSDSGESTVGVGAIDCPHVQATIENKIEYRHGFTLPPLLRISRDDSDWGYHFAEFVSLVL
jgi:hypothetical protein